MAVRSYDPKNVLVSIGGVPMSGFADGTFLEVSRDENAFTKVTGADGFTSRVKSNNRGGLMTLTLLETSPSNDVLSAYAALDEISGTGIVPVLIKDVSGTSLYFSATGWVQKLPDSTFGKDINNRAWTLDLADVDVFIGGNSETG